MVDIIAIPQAGLGNTSWLVDIGDGTALVVDPARDPRPYLAEARHRSVDLRLGVDTHLHADFITGGRELASAAGTRLVAPAASGITYDHQPVGDGDELDLGEVALRVLATPGHSPDHVSYLLVRGEEPLALFSGGALTVGGVARPDLISAERTRPLASAAWASITERILTLPDHTPLHPTHGGGSFCSAGTGGSAHSTIGAERSANPLLQASDADDFTERLLGSLGTYPPYFRRLRERNRTGPRVYGTSTPRLAGLTPDEVATAMADGVAVIDTRPVADFAGGHIPGSISIELRDQLATWLGWVIADPDAPIVFVVGSDQDEDRLVRDCLNIGFENLIGKLSGGVEAWRASGRPLDTIPVSVDPLDDRRVIDVRQRSEWELDHLAEATHLEAGEIAEAPDRAPDEPLVVHCGHGQRAMTAASLLREAGHDDVAVFLGGVETWRRALRTTAR